MSASDKRPSLLWKGVVYKNKKFNRRFPSRKQQQSDFLFLFFGSPLENVATICMGNVRDVVVPNVAKGPQLLLIFVIFLSH
jgi:hypothetical protein